MTIFVEVAVRPEIRSLSDEALEQEHAQGDVLRVTGVPSTLRRDLNRWQNEIESEMRRRKPVTESVPDNWQMYTERANQAVATAIFGVARRLAAGEFTDEARFLNAIEKALKPVGKKHGELYDTEPRGQIRDWADMVGMKQGWCNEYTSYGEKTGDKIDFYG